MFSWVPQKPQNSAAKRKINSRISECPNLNVIFHCRSSMKTMKGCDFCSKDSSGGIVVCCSSYISNSKHNSITPIPQTVLLLLRAGFADQTAANQYVAAAGEKIKPPQDNSWLLWGKFCLWKVPLLSLVRVGARGALCVQEAAEVRRKHSVVCAGEKPSPECMKMPCDKIYFALLFQQVLK